MFEKTWEQCQILMRVVFNKQSAVLFGELEVHLYSVSICVFAFCWKPTGALIYILYSERELKPFKVETEYWQYVNRREENIFLRERKAFKESKWIDHSRLFFVFLTAVFKLAFPPFLHLYLFCYFFSDARLNLSVFLF